MPYQQFNTVFTSTPAFPLAHSQCSINELSMGSPLHTICLDEGMEHSFIHANYADNYLPNIEWIECQCPLSGHQTHYTNVTMTFWSTCNTFITLDVCLYRGSINTNNNIIIGTNDLWENNVTINNYDLSMNFIQLWSLCSWSKERIQVCCIINTCNLVDDRYWKEDDGYWKDGCGEMIIFVV